VASLNCRGFSSIDPAFEFEKAAVGQWRRSSGGRHCEGGNSSDTGQDGAAIEVV
jgi:hypothetical protein